MGHNLLSFDVHTLNRLWDTGLELDRCCDTLVLSLLFNPALEDGHSLAAWGRRLKFPKGEISDWSECTPEMIEYCRNDVRLTCLLYKKLTERMLKIGYSEQSAEIEHKIRVIINDQQRNGFYFNRFGAEDFLLQLRKLQADLTEQIHGLFPPSLKLIKTGTFRRNKDGSLPAFITSARDRYKRVVVDETSGTYEYHDLEEFNIGSPKQRVERLVGVGWEPTSFTEKGFPKVDEDSLVLFADTSGRPEVRAMADWLVLQGRSSMVETWLNNLGDDSRIHGRVNSCGATTRRMTHSNPNTANIPSGAKAKYGHECRALWQASPGTVLVGYDAAGLETAGLCHYLGNAKATDILLRPKPDDIHTTNARRLSEALGRPVDREWGAKTTWYAWLYGAFPKKLGEILKGTPSDGEVVIETFFRNVPGLKGLIDEVRNEYYRNNGRLTCIDGGFVICPSASASLNYLIQSLGTILIKLSQIILDEEAKRIGLPFKLVASIHDESQCEVEKKYAEQLGKLAIWSIEEAGRQLKLNVPVTGEYKIGTNWSQTH